VPASKWSGELMGLAAATGSLPVNVELMTLQVRAWCSSVRVVTHHVS
jgi:hypothetical protein